MTSPTTRQPPTTRQQTSTRAQPSKVTVAYEAIRAQIADGTCPPGTRLVLDRLARELDMSTLPVREAIRRLEAEGLVHFQQNVGATVSAFDAQSFIQAVETLAVLESAATAQAAAHVTPDDLEAAAELNAAMAEAIDSLDGPVYAARHDEFHALLTSRCPNAHLIHMAAQERARLQRVRLATLALGAGGRREVDEHDALLQLIATGAPADDIEDLNRAHTIAVTAAFARSAGPSSARAD